MREEFFVFAVELGGESFVGGDDQDGFIELGNDVGGCESFAAAGDAQKRLEWRIFFEAVNQLFDSLGLVAGGFEW